MKNNGKSISHIVFLHVVLLIYSLGGYFSKSAALADFFSIKFIVCYAIVIAFLALYAIAWQQIIKRMPLSTAYANKAIIVVWGIIWGKIFFNEIITVGKILGAGFIIAGIVLYALEDKIIQKTESEELQNDEQD